jgi:hypothetical protein
LSSSAIICCYVYLTFHRYRTRLLLLGHFLFLEVTIPFGDCTLELGDWVSGAADAHHHLPEGLARLQMLHSGGHCLYAVESPLIDHHLQAPACLKACEARQTLLVSVGISREKEPCNPKAFYSAACMRWEVLN